MFLDELTPLMRELVGHPAAFLGGFMSGLLRLNLSEEPVKGWLNKQGATVVADEFSNKNDHRNNGSGPQTISIE